MKTSTAVVLGAAGIAAGLSLLWLLKRKHAEGQPTPAGYLAGSIKVQSVTKR